MKLFGKTIGATAIIMIMLTASLGATVLYLSNDAFSKVAVTAPFEVGMSKDRYGNWTESLTLDPKHGGEMSEFYIKYQNFANETLKVNVSTLITCNLGISRADFEQSDVELDGLYYELYGNDSSMISSGYFNEDPYTMPSGSNTLVICGGTSSIFPMYIDPLTTHIVKIEMYHAPNAYGIYRTTTQVMDA